MKLQNRNNHLYWITEFMRNWIDKEEQKPVSVSFSFNNNEITVIYNKSDFSKIFGNIIDDSMIIESFFDNYILRKKFDENGFVLTIKTYITKNEVMAKKIGV